MRLCARQILPILSSDKLTLGKLSDTAAVSLSAGMVPKGSGIVKRASFSDHVPLAGVGDALTGGDSRAILREAHEGLIC